MSKFALCILLLAVVVAVSMASPLIVEGDENQHVLSRRQSSPMKEDPAFRQIVKQALIDLENVPSDPFGRGLQSIDPAFSRAAAAVLDEIHLVAKAMIPRTNFQVALAAYSLLDHAKSLVNSCAAGQDRNVPDCLLQFASLGVDMATRFVCASISLETEVLAGKLRVSANTMCSAATFYLASVIKYAMLEQIPLETLLGGRFKKLSLGIVSGNYAEAYEGVNTLTAPFVKLVKKVNSMEPVTEEDIEVLGVDLPR
ncbi:hypothetical protein BKA69DRAFT_1176967 [Paraphysoderma sedebokerense]|nr:hypothetical protein BKA69DRAFT_1176967 [Paraphysoderma sedebokerense]